MRRAKSISKQFNIVARSVLLTRKYDDTKHYLTHVSLASVARRTDGRDIAASVSCSQGRCLVQPRTLQPVSTDEQTAGTLQPVSRAASAGVSCSRGRCSQCRQTNRRQGRCSQCLVQPVPVSRAAGDVAASVDRRTDGRDVAASVSCSQCQCLVQPGT